MFERVRDPDALATQQIQPSQMPSAHGDYYEPANGRGGETDPAFLHSVARLQYALLSAWQKGDFVEDWGQVPADPPAITPEGLDRAALENMSGGAFYPGMEASWPLRRKKSGTNPFVLLSTARWERISVPGENRRDVMVAAGAFSQQMALPWQADFLDCAADFVVDPIGRGWTASSRMVAYDSPGRSVPGRLVRKIGDPGQECPIPGPPIGFPETNLKMKW